MRRMLHGRRQFRQQAALAVLLAAAPLALACREHRASDRSQPLESAGREVAVDFPPSARLIGVHRERGMDELIAAKVEMPAADWPGFLEGIPMDPKLFEPGEGGLLGPDEDFWDPHQAKSLHTSQAQLPGNRTLNLGYDDSRGNVIVVYVVNHGH